MGKLRQASRLIGKLIDWSMAEKMLPRYNDPFISQFSQLTNS